MQKQYCFLEKSKKNFNGNSFKTISSYDKNSSMIHYSPSNENNKNINNKSIYLIDSGGQYLEGTTDITRSIHLGPIKNIQKNYYTIILKGHIAIQKIIFPTNTKGCQIDILARKEIWKENLDYKHSTGHGVGSFLNVHEPPQSISQAINNNSLINGMILSNEPGIYFPKNFGIRIENLCFVKKNSYNYKKNNTNFYCFKQLTLVPYAYKLIKISLLTKEEKLTINKYNKNIRKEIIKYIKEKQLKKWFLSNTKNI